jgi:hypothetical protein
MSAPPKLFGDGKGRNYMAPGTSSGKDDLHISPSAA